LVPAHVTKRMMSDAMGRVEALRSARPLKGFRRETDGLPCGRDEHGAMMRVFVARGPRPAKPLGEAGLFDN